MRLQTTASVIVAGLLATGFTAAASLMPLNKSGTEFTKSPDTLEDTTIEAARAVCADVKNPNISDARYINACAAFYTFYLERHAEAGKTYSTEPLKNISDALVSYNMGKLPYTKMLLNLSLNMSTIQRQIDSHGIQPSYEIGEVATGVYRVINAAAQGKKGVRYQPVAMN